MIDFSNAPEGLIAVLGSLVSSAIVATLSYFTNKKAIQSAEKTHKSEQNFTRDLRAADTSNEEKKRQRRAISELINIIRDAETKADSVTRDSIINSSDYEQLKNNPKFKLERAFSREDFYSRILAAFQSAELEITDPEVKRAMDDLLSCFNTELSDFQEKRENNVNEWINSFGHKVALSAQMQCKMNRLRQAAWERLHVSEKSMIPLQLTPPRHRTPPRCSHNEHRGGEGLDTIVGCPTTPLFYQ